VLEAHSVAADVPASAGGCSRRPPIRSARSPRRLRTSAVVLDALEPAERLAFVLHDMFAVPFDEIAPMVERSPAATRQLASRARRRVQGATPFPDADLSSQREVIDAFLAASREGDFQALIAILHPEVVLRADRGALSPGASQVVRGAAAVAEQTMAFARSRRGEATPALINGEAGVVWAAQGRPYSVVGFTVRRGQIVAIDVLADPVRLQQLAFDVLDASPRRRDVDSGRASGA
jgi:hypothetical protein